MRFAVFVILLSTLDGASLAQAQGHGRLSHRFSFDLGAGSHFRDAGDVESMSLGVALSPFVTLAATVERGHVPTRVTAYPDGYSATRNGTLTSASGELRVTIPAGRRWTPYGLVGRGVGKSVFNVNTRFPDPITRSADLFYAGAGVRYALGSAIALFSDAKFMLVMGRSAGDLSARLPIRAGVSFRF
jgi:hypothetical protein